MKKIVIVSIIILIGMGLAGVVSASFNWDKEITFDLSDDFIIDQKSFLIIGPDFIPPITGEIDLYTNKGKYIIGETVEITIENNGEKEAWYCGSYSHWTVEQYQDGVWMKIYPQIEILLISEDSIIPGEKEESIWDENTGSGNYRIVVSYFIDDPKYKFTEYSYFSIEHQLYDVILTAGPDSIYQPQKIIPWSPPFDQLPPIVISE